MLISAKYGFVVLFMQKCASNSIEEMLLPHSDILFVNVPAFRHTDYRQYVKYIEPYLAEVGNIKKIETICVMREPLSWLNSWYRFRARHNLRDPEHPKHRNSTAGMEFVEFVAAHISATPPPCANVGRQYQFLRDDNGGIGVDTIFRYENLGEFVAYMSERVGETLTLGRKNVSPRGAYKSKFAEMIGFTKRRVSRKLGIDLNMSPPRSDLGVPEDLIKSLRDFIPEDFELYEKLLEK